MTRSPRCDVIATAEAIFVLGRTASVPGTNLSDLSGPILRLDREPVAADLGRAVIATLDRSDRPPVDPPRSFDEVDRRYARAYQAAGLPGASRLYSSARLIKVEDQGEWVQLRPSTHRPTDPAIDDISCDRSPETIGQELLQILPLCPASDALGPVRVAPSYRPDRADALPDGGVPASFGYKNRWVVVDSTDARRVASVLGLRELRPSTWEINPYGPAGVFVSPSVLGWTYILGHSLAPWYDGFLETLERWSRELGEIQYFGNHRVSSWVSWAKAQDGRIVRAYDFAQEFTFDIGELTAEERELGFAQLINQQTFAQDDADSRDWPGEDDVMQLAGRWSINPQELDAYPARGIGLLGREPTRFDDM